MSEGSLPSRAHYRQLLGPVYTWLFGEVEERAAQELAWFEALGFKGGERALAVDLGCGPGYHSLALAALGYQVLAIDQDPLLLKELKSKAGKNSVTAVTGDLLGFSSRLKKAPVLVICLGDTLLHLGSKQQVAALFQEAASALAPGGEFLLSFRNLSQLPPEGGRCLPVKQEAHRILLCFLEAQTSQRVMVTDVLLAWDGNSWRLTQGAYPKLRLAPAWVKTQLKKSGFSRLQEERLSNGMVLIRAVAASY